MSGKIKISIGLPVTKTPFLKDAIASCLFQSYDNFELIIINNAIDLTGKEEIKSIVKSFSDTRIRYYENEVQLPIIENWNYTLSFATGDYFCLFSDDDLYEKAFLFETVKMIETYPEVNVIHTRVKIIDESNVCLGYSSSCPEYESVYNFIWHRLKSFRNQYIPEFICKTKVLQSIGGFVNFPLAWCSDDATWYMLAKENGIAYIDKPLCNWRYSQINLSRIGSVKLRLDALQKFYTWQTIYFNSLIPVSEMDVFMLSDILIQREKWFQNARASLLSSGNSIFVFDIIKTIRHWLAWRNTYTLNARVLLKALLNLLIQTKKN